MKININNNEIELKYSFRAYMIYENITNEPFEAKGLHNFIVLFYCIYVTSTDLDILDFDGFVDWLDANPNKLDEFTKWLVSIIERNKKLSKETSKKETATKKAPKTKKETATKNS